MNNVFVNSSISALDPILYLDSDAAGAGQGLPNCKCFAFNISSTGSPYDLTWTVDYPTGSYVAGDLTSYRASIKSLNQMGNAMYGMDTVYTPSSTPVSFTTNATTGFHVLVIAYQAQDNTPLPFRVKVQSGNAVINSTTFSSKWDVYARNYLAGMQILQKSLAGPAYSLSNRPTQTALSLSSALSFNFNFTHEIKSVKVDLNVDPTTVDAGDSSISVTINLDPAVNTCQIVDVTLYGDGFDWSAGNISFSSTGSIFNDPLFLLTQVGPQNAEYKTFTFAVSASSYYPAFTLLSVHTSY